MVLKHSFSLRRCCHAFQGNNLGSQRLDIWIGGRRVEQCRSVKGCKRMGRAMWSGFAQRYWLGKDQSRAAGLARRIRGGELARGCDFEGILTVTNGSLRKGTVPITPEIVRAMAIRRPLTFSVVWWPVWVAFLTHTSAFWLYLL